MVNIGIIGFGFVGAAVGQMSSCFEVNVYDKFIKQYNSVKDRQAAYSSSVVFINVPTDLNEEGRLDTTIIENCIQDYVQYAKNRDNTVVIKSTVPVGLCDMLSEKYNLTNLVFNPEFLSQRTAMEDFRDQKELYLAGSKEHTSMVRGVYEEFFDTEENYNVEIFETSNFKQVELLKLARNSFYAVKVSYCNYLYNLCEENGIEYESFREDFARGEWVGEQHTRVPGPDGKFGYGGKCLPKDSIELSETFKDSFLYDFSVLEESIKFNGKQRGKE